MRYWYFLPLYPRKWSLCLKCLDDWFTSKPIKDILKEVNRIGETNQGWCSASASRPNSISPDWITLKVDSFISLSVVIRDARGPEWRLSVMDWLSVWDGEKTGTIQCPFAWCPTNSSAYPRGVYLVLLYTSSHSATSPFLHLFLAPPRVEIHRHIYRNQSMINQSIRTRHFGRKPISWWRSILHSNGRRFWKWIELNWVEGRMKRDNSCTNCTQGKQNVASLLLEQMGRAITGNLRPCIVEMSLSNLGSDEWCWEMVDGTLYTIVTH